MGEITPDLQTGKFATGLPRRVRQVLREIMTTANNPATQLAAATALLDRGFAKPFQAVAISELPPIDVNIDASIDPVMATAAWARMIGSDTPRQRGRGRSHTTPETGYL